MARPISLRAMTPKRLVGILELLDLDMGTTVSRFHQLGREYAHTDGLRREKLP